MMNFSSKFFEPPTSSALVPTKGGNSNPAVAFDNSASQSSNSNGGSQPYVMVPYALFQEMSGGQASSFPLVPYDQSQGQGGSMQFTGAGQYPPTDSSSNLPTMSGTLNFSGTTGNKYVLQGNFYNPIFMTDGSSAQQQQQNYPTNDQQQYYAPPPQYSMPPEPSLPSQPSNNCPPQQPQQGGGAQYGQPPMMMMPYIVCQYNPQGYGNSQPPDNTNSTPPEQQPPDSSSADGTNSNNQPPMHHHHHYRPIFKQPNPPQNSNTGGGNNDGYGDGNSMPDGCSPAPATTPPPPPPADCQTPPPPAPVPAPPPPAYSGNDTGCYQGDPDFTGFNAKLGRINGTSGNDYNVLSDKGFQYNTLFNPADNGQNVVTEAGIQVDQNKINYKVGSGPTLNSQAMTSGKTYNLGTNESAKWDGTTLDVNNGTYDVQLSGDPSHNYEGLKSNVTIQPGANPLANGNPGGILGQTITNDSNFTADMNAEDFKVADIWGHQAAKSS